MPCCQRAGILFFPAATGFAPERKGPMRRKGMKRVGAGRIDYDRFSIIAAISV
jgi:hypothetical protein